MKLLAEYPLKATADEDYALRVGICRLLAAQGYYVNGSPAFHGYVADDTAATPGVTELACYPEWTDGEVQLATPCAVILDATGTYQPSAALEDEVLIEDGGSLWQPTGSSGDGPSVTLREQGEYEVQFAVMLLATDRPTRSALVTGARSALTPSRASSETREGIVVDLGDLYWGRKARYKLTGLTRQDADDSSGTKRRSVLLSVRASVIVVEPVELDLLQHVGFLDPVDPDGELRAIT